MNKISPGTTLLERSAFMRSTKYNIGGVMHSLLDVSAAVLDCCSVSIRVGG